MTRRTKAPRMPTAREVVEEKIADAARTIAACSDRVLDGMDERRVLHHHDAFELLVSFRSASKALRVAADRLHEWERAKR